MQNPIHAQLSVVIQAGGLSSRMGENKALKPFLGEALIRRVMRRVQPLAGEVLITLPSGGLPELEAELAGSGVVMVADRFPQLGPLGGLLTGMMAASRPAVALVGCDMPFISQALLTAALERLDKPNPADVVVPRSPDGLEPLHALYRRETCLPAVERAVAANRLRMIGWFQEVRVIELPAEEVERIEPGFRCFINVNTPEEFKDAEALARETD